MFPIRLFVGVAAAWLAVPCWSQQGQASSCGELLSQAIQNNRELLSVKQRGDEARGLLRQAGVRPALTLEASGATGRPLGTAGEEQFGAGVAQVLETGGKRSRRIQVAEKQVALAEAEYDERIRQLRFEICSRYAEYSSEAERLVIVERLREAFRSSLELMQARVEQGDAAALERDLLFVEMNRAEAQRAASFGRLEAARTDLARLAGLSEPEAVPLPKAVPLQALGSDITQLKEKSVRQRPDLRASEILKQQGDAESAMAQAQGRADVTLSAGYSRVYSRFDDQPTSLRDRDDVVSVGVSIPIFGRDRNVGNIEAAVARTRGAQYRREFLERSIPLEVEGAWRRLSNARRAHETLDQVVLRQAEKNLDVIRRGYELGQLRLLDVLNEQRRLLDTKLAAIDAKLDVRRALAELERASGGELQ